MAGVRVLASCDRGVPERLGFVRRPGANGPHRRMQGIRIGRCLPVVHAMKAIDPIAERNEGRGALTRSRCCARIRLMNFDDARIRSVVQILRDGGQTIVLPRFRDLAAVVAGDHCDFALFRKLS